MKSLVFVFSFVFLSLGSMDSLEAQTGRCRLRRSKKCCVVSRPVSSCNPCNTTTQCTPTCNPCITTTQYAQSSASSYTSPGMPTYASGVATPTAWGTQPGMSQTYTAMKPRQTVGTAQEWAEISSKIDDYVYSRNMTICDLKKISPAYSAIISELERSGDKLKDVCYPTKEAWIRRADVRANIVQALTNVGVLQPVLETPIAQTTPESSSVTPVPVALGGPLEATTTSGAASLHNDVLNKISTYLAANELEICDLRSAIPAYGKIIDRLDQNEKYKPEMGAPRICYPSPEVWEADTKGVKTDIMAVLTEQGIL